MKRKRKPHTETNTSISHSKKQKRDIDVVKQPIVTVVHPVLQHYYPKVLTLRQYLLSNLPSASKRRQKILHGLLPTTNNVYEDDDSASRDAYDLLDDVLVGVGSGKCSYGEQARKHDLQQFSQQLSASNQSVLFADQNTLSQKEVMLCFLFLNPKIALDVITVHVKCTNVL